MSDSNGPFKEPARSLDEHRLSKWRPPILVAGTYVIFGLLWIMLSDRAVAVMFTDIATINFVQTIKGLGYVLVTGLLIFGLVRRYVSSIVSNHKESSSLRVQYQDLFDHAPDAIIIHDLEGRILAVNDVTCKRLGYTSQELLNMTPRDFDLPEFAALIPQRLKALIENGELVFESAHVARDGGVIPVEISTRVIIVDGKQVALANCRDITERKAAAKEMLRSEAQFRTIFENAPLAVAVVSPNYEVLRGNGNFYRFLGYTADTIDGVAVEDVVHAHDMPKLDAARDKLAGGERSSVSIECRFIKKDQSVAWGQLNACAQRSASEELEYYLVHLMDITDRKQRERELRLTQYTVNHSFDAVFWMDESARFVYVNDTACRMLGYTRDELLGMDVYDIDPVFTPEAWNTAWQELKTCQSYNLESIHRRRDGTDFPIEVMASHVSFEGLTYNCAFVRDITDRKRADQESRAMQDRLERAQRMESLGILAGGVAHDLNNMLGPLVGYPELILQSPNVDERTRRHVERMAQSASEAADVIQDLLTLARRGRYDMESISLNDVARHFIDSPIYSKLSESHPDITLSLNLDTSIDNIKGSMPHLSKVFMNLIVNAFDAMPDGGQLIVSTSQKHVDQLQTDPTDFEAGDHILLRVADTGKGISAEDMPKIFEPYYSKKRMGRSGSGLGLSVVYGIVKDHHGFYDVVSEVGKGTSFTFYFPTTAEAATEVQAATASFGGQESILVVDDSRDQRELAADLLASFGYYVRTVTNGHEAVAELRTRPSDLVVLDMILEPGFDGLDTFREIKKLRPDQKCIIISGFSATERVDEMQRLGAGAYIRKPYTREALNRAIREALDQPIMPQSK